MPYNETTQSFSEEELKGLPGMKILLMGDSGTGKTHSIRTLVDAGLEVFCIFTEPGMDILAEVPVEKLHWNYTSPSSVSWAEMQESSRKLNTMAFKALTELPHINRGSHAEYMTVQGVCDNYVDQRTGIEYGSIDKFGTDRVVVLDSFSGLSYMALNLITGSKPVKHVGEYGCAMDNLERFTIKLTQDIRCHAVIIGHKAKEKDDSTGGLSSMIDTIGAKLAPKLPKLFTDIIDTQRIGDRFSWSTTTPNTILKARNLPWANEIPPTFVPMLAKWRDRDRMARGGEKT